MLGQILIHKGQILGVLLSKGPGLTEFTDRREAVAKHIHRTFGNHDNFAVHIMYGGHQLSVAVEGQLV